MKSAKTHFTLETGEYLITPRHPDAKNYEIKVNGKVVNDVVGVIRKHFEESKGENVEADKVDFEEIIKNIGKEWTSFKRPKTFKEAIEWLDFVNSRGEDPQWSIQYYGFGEHFTFWSGYGGFIDFDIDNGTGIDWHKMKEIIIESAQTLYDDLRENRPHLFGEKGDEK